MSEPRFYVYALLDPRDGQPFYVGKGQGARAWQHTADVCKGRPGPNAAKQARIEEILSCGLVPVAQIAYRTDCEQDAFDTEADLIAATPGLTNIMAGGGRGLTPEQFRQRAQERESRARQRQHAATREWLKAWLEMESSWSGVTFPGLRDGDQQAERFVADVRALLAT